MRSPHPHDAFVQMMRNAGAIPPDHETFSMEVEGSVVLYDVTAAQQLTRGRMATMTVNTFEQAGAITFPGHPPEIGGGITVDPEYAMTVDLRQPLILLFMPERWGCPWGLLIDGWHRVWKGFQLGIETLPAVVIAPHEEHLVRLHPPAEFMDAIADRNREMIDEFNRISYAAGAPRFEAPVPREEALP